MTVVFATANVHVVLFRCLVSLTQQDAVVKNVLHHQQVQQRVVVLLREMPPAVLQPWRVLHACVRVFFQ